MAIESNLQTPPVFTECVGSDQTAKAPPGDPKQMARKLQELIEQIQSQPNPAVRALLQECLQTLLAFYGEGLTRILEHIHEGGPGGQAIIEQLGKDTATSGLLLIHGLHPVPLESRLRSALDTVTPYMQSHGGNIELLSFENGIARVKLQGTCKTCPSSAVTLELAVRRAVEEACPDLIGFEVVDNKMETVAA